MNADDYLFVYGALRPGVGGEMAQYLAANATHICGGRVRGKLYRVSWYPGLVPSPRTVHAVRGDVFHINAARLLPKLDAYENAATQPVDEHDYLRRRMRVTLDDGRRIHAWTYVYRRAAPESVRIPSGDFLADMAA